MTLQKIFQQLIPYILLGTAIAFAICLLMMFSYVLIWGMVIGCSIWLLGFIKNSLFSKKVAKDTQGRIIEHEKID